MLRRSTGSGPLLLVSSRSAGKTGAGSQRWCGRTCLALPVVRSIVLVVDADRVLDHHRVAALHIVDEPLRIGGANVDAAVADVALALIGQRPRGCVHKNAGVRDPGPRQARQPSPTPGRQWSLYRPGPRRRPSAPPNPLPHRPQVADQPPADSGPPPLRGTAQPLHNTR